MDLNHQILRPQSIAEALRWLAEELDSRFLSGDMSLLPAMKQGLSSSSHLINLAHLTELQGMRVEGARLDIGAATSHQAVAASPIVLSALPVLAGLIADPQVTLRDHLRLTGTHVNWDTTQCGCCTAHLSGRAVKSCAFLTVQAEGGTITTIEGLANGQDLHPMQRAFSQEHALQCGLCTPGMIMSAVEFLADNPHPDKQAVAHGLDGNLCGCAGYIDIVDAMARVAGEPLG